jgi:hypothetical protein
LANTPEKAQRQRKKVEALCGELKNQIELRRSRRLKLVREQFFLAAVAQNSRLAMLELSKSRIETKQAAIFPSMPL